MPILFVSGNADHARLEAEHVLDKPFTHDSLARKLDELLDQDQAALRVLSKAR